MKLGSLILSFLALACAGGLESASLADSHGKFPGKGSVEAYNKSCVVGHESNQLSRKGDYEGAIKLDRKAIDIYPLDSMWYHNLACDLAKLKRYDEAIKIEEQGITLEPNFVGAWIKKGECFEFSGRLDEAEKCYRKAFNIDSGSFAASFNTGDILLQQGKPKEAKVWFLRAEQLTKNPSALAEVTERLKKLRPILEASQ